MSEVLPYNGSYENNRAAQSVARGAAVAARKNAESPGVKVSPSTANTTCESTGLPDASSQLKAIST